MREMRMLSPLFSTKACHHSAKHSSVCLIMNFASKALLKLVVLAALATITLLPYAEAGGKNEEDDVIVIANGGGC